jgi:SAM-dependent methyltransferase
VIGAALAHFSKVTEMTQSPDGDHLAVPPDPRARHAANRAGWNEGARHYTAEIEATIAFIAQGGSNLHPVERRNLGDLRAWCGTAIHLQCASGRDTLSLLNEGVGRVVGVDISDVHIANARQICAGLAALGRPVAAEWMRGDVLDTPAALDGTADLVYTGRGALCWLHDLPAYAQVVARLLKPGGVYHVLDDHPFTGLFEAEATGLVFRGASYFDQVEASVGWPTTYIGDSLGIPVAEQAVKYEHGWNLMDITQALLGAGLTLEYLGEHPEPYWDNFPNLAPPLRGKLPLTFSLLARKPR